jgi:hypothetical protein
VRIEDEFGSTWHVEPHDPARASVLALKRLGYEYQVLPEAVLRGIIKDDGVEAELLNLSNESVTDNLLPRHYRLLDCLRALAYA